MSSVHGLLQVVIRGKDEVQQPGRLPDLRSAAQGLRLFDMPGAMRPSVPPAARPPLPVQFPMQINAPPRPAMPGASPLASLVCVPFQSARKPGDQTRSLIINVPCGSMWD